MKARSQVITALILGGGATCYMLATALPDGQDRNPAESAERESGLVALLAKLDVYIYSHNNIKLGVLDKDSCVLAQPPL